MPVYLDESQFGTAADVIGFPHLLICMGFVALTDVAMFGMHSDVRTDMGLLAQELAGYMAARNVQNDIVALYGCGNWNIRYGNTSNKHLHWQAEMREAAAALGFTGPARGFDTSIIAPLNGTYVEYRPNYPAQSCRIYYKRHEKMTYQNTYRVGAAVNPNIKQLSNYLRRPIDVNSETTGADVVATRGNAGNLHEVDYALRLTSFNV